MSRIPSVRLLREPSPARSRASLANLPNSTPAFLFDLDGIATAAERVATIAQEADCQALYAVKALALPEVVRTIAMRLDGLAVSSLAEARLASSILMDRFDKQPRTVQLTTPGLRLEEFDELANLCDTLVFNSLTQWERFGPAAVGRACGLRVNPQLSWLDDDRYDPCRQSSQLGVPLGQLAAAWQDAPQSFAGIAGLHFHNNYRANTTAPLAATVRHVAAAIAPLLGHVEWLNVGGGYDLTAMDAAALAPLAETAQWLQDAFGTKLLVEPGSTLVRRHGWLVSAVIDLFESDGRQIAVLDTSVAHLAEVFEYQRPPAVLSHMPEGSHAYALVGCSCLAGDRFGEYRFDHPLAVGERIVFAEVGAYALSKVQQFNGIAPPAVELLQ